MLEFLRICGVAILGTVIALLIRRENPSLGLMLSMVCCILLAFAGMAVMEPVIGFFRSLQELSGLSSSLLSPFMKTVGIGLLTQIAASVCQDAGQGAIARMVELCGSILALYLALPLLTAVLNLLGELTGGTG